MSSPNTAAASSSHLADAAAQVLITRCHDVALVLAHPLTQAVISICTLVCAGDALNPWILQDSRQQQPRVRSGFDSDATSLLRLVLCCLRQTASTAAAHKSIVVTAETAALELSTASAHKDVLTFAILSATLYFWPSFSNSARTQSVMQGVHSAYRQSNMPFTRSICSSSTAQQQEKQECQTQHMSPWASSSPSHNPERALLPLHVKVQGGPDNVLSA